MCTPYLFDLGVPDEETPQGVAGVHFGAFQRHHDVAVLLAVLRGPVLVTLPLGGGVRQSQSLTAPRPAGIWEEVEPTLPFSTRLVIMMMIPVFCSHTMRQKSSNVDLRGPWAAM